MRWRGSIAVSGSLVQWVRDNLGLISSAPEIETLAASVEDNGGCYFVPAFSGLFAPYWRDDARGAIVGLTRYVNKGHIARAVLEATAFQTKEVLDAMNADSGVDLTTLKVDGGMVVNETLMQFQADILGRPGDPAGGRRDHRARRCLRRRPRRRVLGERGRTSAPTGPSPSGGNRRWTRSSAPSCTRSGRRPSPRPSTGSTPATRTDPHRLIADRSSQDRSHRLGRTRRPFASGPSSGVLTGCWGRHRTASELRKRHNTIIGDGLGK